MNIMALGMSVGSLMLSLGTWIVYFATIPRSKVPVRPVGSIISQFSSIILAISAILWSFQGRSSSGGAVFILAGFGLMMALFFLWLLTQRKTPIGDLKVKVGDKLLSFEAITSEGAAFHTDELAGKRILLKFFRGGW